MEQGCLSFPMVLFDVECIQTRLTSIDHHDVAIQLKHKGCWLFFWPQSQPVMPKIFFLFPLSTFKPIFHLWKKVQNDEPPSKGEEKKVWNKVVRSWRRIRYSRCCIKWFFTWDENWWVISSCYIIYRASASKNVD